MKKLFFTLFMSLMIFTAHAQSTLLGDVNGDGKVTVADAMMVVNIIMKGYAPFSVEPTSVSMPVGGTATLEISGGYNKYEVMSANTTLVEASFDGTTITLTAIASGDTKVIVKDVLTMRYVEIPVSVGYAPLQLSTSELSLIVGSQDMVNITSGSGNYSVKSSNTNVVKAVIDGFLVKVTAVSTGTATITVTDHRSGQTATMEVKVNENQAASLCPDDHHPHLIDLGLPSGTKWACCNVDTDHPEKQSPINYGGFFAWGETETKPIYDWSSYIYCNGTWDTCYDIGNCISGTEYDVAFVKWGGKWQMPTFTQIEELYENCLYIWLTLNGVKGVKFTSKKNSMSIFMPVAGDRFSSDQDNSGFYDGFYGGYWSGTPMSHTVHAYCLYFNSNIDDIYLDDARYLGHCIRPVVTN